MFKKIAATLSGLAIAFLPFAGVGAATVSIEGTTDVANVTTNTQYQNAVDAKVDEIVKIQVWYHNKEDENSGKVANNLKVKVNLPTAPGKNQTVTGTISSDNSNTITDTAQVNLSLANARLEYIPGSAKWRHNAGTNTNVNYVTESISDEVVTNGVTLENAKPCFNFEATVTVLARVKADSVSITKQVRKVGETTWVTKNSAKPGDELEYLITFKNEGNTTLESVVVGDNMPAHVTYVPGTTMLKNGSFPNGTKITSDKITDGGITLGNYAPGAVGYVWFRAKIDASLAPGNYELKNVGIVRPKGMNEFFNTAITTVSVVKPQQPTPTPTPPTPPTPPTTPEQPVLPETGIGSALGGAMGLGGLGYALRSYTRSRRGLLDALKDVK